MYIARTHTHKRQPSVKILLIKNDFDIFTSIAIFILHDILAKQDTIFITVGNCVWTRDKHYNK